MKRNAQKRCIRIGAMRTDHSLKTVMFRFLLKWKLKQYPRRKETSWRGIANILIPAHILNLETANEHIFPCQRTNTKISSHQMFRYPYKILKICSLHAATAFWTAYTRLVLRLNGVQFGKKLKAVGRPIVNVSIGGKAFFGRNLYIRTGVRYTEVGAAGSRILVGPQGTLTIGDNVGMSNATIVADQSVSIGSHVLIGGGVQIFDTNFHSTDTSVRTGGNETRKDARKAPVVIEDNVFIGTNAIICKGVTIGRNSIVAAGSVVVKTIPPNEIWGGNPAQKLS